MLTPSFLLVKSSKCLQVHLAPGRTSWNSTVVVEVTPWRWRRSFARPTSLVMLGASERDAFHWVSYGLERPQKMTETTVKRSSAFMGRCSYCEKLANPSTLQGVSSGDQPAFGGCCTVAWWHGKRLSVTWAYHGHIPSFWWMTSPWHPCHSSCIPCFWIWFRHPYRVHHCENSETGLAYRAKFVFLNEPLFIPTLPPMLCQLYTWCHAAFLVGLVTMLFPGSYRGRLSVTGRFSNIT